MTVDSLCSDNKSYCVYVYDKFIKNRLECVRGGGGTTNTIYGNKMFFILMQSLGVGWELLLDNTYDNWTFFYITDQYRV